MTPRTAGGLYLATEPPTVVHRLPAQVKLIAAVVLVGAGVAIPTSALGPDTVLRWAALGVILILALVLVATARLPWGRVSRRLVIEVPFLVFALALPFVAAGDRVDVLGLPLSLPGLIGAAAVLLKATTGVLTGIVLSATTRPEEVLDGLRRLRLPAVVVGITSFMIRYAGVVLDDLGRMRLARVARGYSGGGLGHLRHEAAGVGTLFVRSYERGERVHQAMLARGYAGTLPGRVPRVATMREWLVGLAVPLLAVALAVGSRVVGP